MKRVLTILFVVAVLSSCTNPKIEEQLNIAEQMLDTHPESALTILQGIARKSILNRRDRAFYALMYSKALDKNYIDIASDTLIMPAVKYYTSHVDAHYTTMAYFYYGRVLENAGDVEAAIKAFIDANRYIANDEPYMAGLLHSHLGDLYLGQSSFQESVDEYTAAIEFFAAAGVEQNRRISLVARAKAHTMSEDYDRAIDDYRQAMEIAVGKHDTVQICRCVSGIATVIFFQQDNAELALSTMTHYLNRYNNGKPTIEMYPLLCLIYHTLGNMHEARHYGEAALENQEYFEKDQLPGLYLLMSKIEAADNDYKSALQYNNKSYDIQMMMEQENRNALVQVVESKYNYELAKEQLTIQQYKNRYLSIVYISIIVIFVVVVCVVFFAIQKRRKAEERAYDESIGFYEATVGEIDSLKASNEALLKELDDSNDQVIRLKQAFNNKINGLNDFLIAASYCEKDHSMFVKRFKKYIKIDSKNKNQMFGDLIAVVNMNYNGILDYLKQNNPQLTHEDLCLCGLICLGFSSQAIGIIFGNTSVRSIYNRRYRLRRNMNVDAGNGEHIETIIVNMMKTLTDK